MPTPGLRINDAFRKLREDVAKRTDGEQELEILQDELKEGTIVLVATHQLSCDLDCISWYRLSDDL